MLNDTYKRRRISVYILLLGKVKGKNFETFFTSERAKDDDNENIHVQRI